MLYVYFLYRFYYTGSISKQQEIIALAKCELYYEVKVEGNLIMAVVTEAFDIPMDIMTKLATGEYRRLGGVV